MYDYTQAALDLQTRAMLDYAVKLTRTPWEMRKGDVDRLRQAGLTDEQILSVVLITCRFNFLTRLADGLGVELEDGVEEKTLSWLTCPARDQAWLLSAHS